MRVTIEKFLEAQEKFSPTRLEKFYYKHFSKDSENSKANWLVFFILLVPFLMGYLGTIINSNRDFIAIATISFSILMIIFAIPWIYVRSIHNLRIRRITKYLNCTLSEYEIAVDKWKHLIK